MEVEIIYGILDSASVVGRNTRELNVIGERVKTGPEKTLLLLVEKKELVIHINEMENYAFQLSRVRKLRHCTSRKNVGIKNSRVV